MAIDATTIWEFRATNGAAGNGGGYANLDPGTSVDYSDQNAAQLTINDGATAGIGNTTLTSAGGGFTAAMVGNVIQLLTGTNLLDGWYQITAFTNGNTVTLDRAPDDGVGGVSGADGKVGGAIDILTDAFLEQCVAGNTVYIKDDGAMVLGEALEVENDGTSALPITVDGYKTSRGDNPTGGDRPVITCAANAFTFDDYWHIRNLDFTITTATGVKIDTGGVIVNCKSQNTSGSAGRYAYYLGQAGFACGCEGISDSGSAFKTTGGALIACYAHDSDKAYLTSNTQTAFFGCIADTCTTTGIDCASWTGTKVINCTIYNCGVGIAGTTAKNCIFLNNIIDACTTGASWSSEIKSNWWDYNCWNNTADVSNVTKGDNSVTGDPGMANPGAGDFTVTTADANVHNKALDVGDLTGATV